jgi:hypothetical protein
MNPSPSATTPEQYIAQLDEPRREQVGRDRLPKADIGKSCVRFRSLDDLDQEVLRELVREAGKSPAASAT